MKNHVFILFALNNYLSYLNFGMLAKVFESNGEDSVDDSVREATPNVGHHPVEMRAVPDTGIQQDGNASLGFLSIFD